MLLLAAASCFDYRKHRIPNALILCGFLIGLAARVTRWITGHGEIGGPVLRAVGIFALFYFFFRLGMLGAGDVKLFSLSVFLLDKADCVPFVAASLVFSGIAAAGKLLMEKNVRERLGYFCSYVADVARCGKLRLYLSGEKGENSSVHMAGPMLAGLLFCTVFL